MINRIFIFLILISLISCGRKMDPKKIVIDKNLEVITDEGIEALKSKKVFFGHMSLGYNIIDGMEKIIEDNARFSEIKIHELSTIDQFEEPGIYHARNGKNIFPKSKCDAFSNLIKEKGFGEKLDIAFFKFCYVDIERDYDINKLFKYYVETIKGIKEKFPDLKIIHVTIPLTAHVWGLKSFMKNILFGDIENVKRNQFNELLINKYKNIDPIYDLAKIESLYPDGKRSTFKYEDETYFSLARQYTFDGGHLNDIGKFYAAKELLRILAELSINTTAYVR